MTLKKKFALLGGATALIIAAMFLVGRYVEEQRRSKLISLCEKLDGTTLEEAKLAIMEFGPNSDPQTNLLVPTINKVWSIGPYYAMFYSSEEVMFAIGKDGIIGKNNEIVGALIRHDTIYRVGKFGKGGVGKALWSKTDHMHLSTVPSIATAKCEIYTKPPLF